MSPFSYWNLLHGIGTTVVVALELLRMEQVHTQGHRLNYARCKWQVGEHPRALIQLKQISLLQAAWTNECAEEGVGLSPETNNQL